MLEPFERAKPLGVDSAGGELYRVTRRGTKLPGIDRPVNSCGLWLVWRGRRQAKLITEVDARWRGFTRL